MKTTWTCIVVLMCGGAGWAAEPTAAKPKAGAVNPVAKILTKDRIAEGWICLFDGQTPFGWKIEGESKIDRGILTLGGKEATTAETTTEFGEFDLQMQYSGKKLEEIELVLFGKPYKLEPMPEAGRWVQGRWEVGTYGIRRNVSFSFGKVNDIPKQVKNVNSQLESGRSTIAIRVPAGVKLELQKVALKPLGTKPIFNGKDLTGWKPVEGKPSVYTVTDQGEINVKNGGGELQSEWQGDDFVLQMDVISNGKHLNSGIFYRALAGQFWQGYEVQIRNQWDGEDRAKPVDFGTGGIYARQPTRKVIPSDGEWFTITLVADGAHMASWVNGYQCTDYVDEKEDAPSARKGRYLGKGCIGLQGHDPTTDLSFKNIRVADLPKGESK